MPGNRKKAKKKNSRQNPSKRRMLGIFPPGEEKGTKFKSPRISPNHPSPLEKGRGDRCLGKI